MRSEDKLLLQALAGANRDRHPIWLMRQAGRYLPEYRAIRSEAGGFLDLCFTPPLAAEVTLQPIRRYGFDAAILFSDILVVPWGLQQKVGFQVGEGPKLDAIREPSGLAQLRLDRMVDHLAPVYETVTRLRQDLPKETTLIGFAGAPWTVATYMIEGGSSRTFAATQLFASTHRPAFDTLIALLVEATVAHLSAQIDAGVEVVQLFDSWASAVDGDDFQHWVVEPTRKIVSALKTHYPTVPIIGFPRAVGPLYEGFAAATGVDAVSIDQGLSLDFVRDRLQPTVCVQGNLDPQVLVAGGGRLDEAARNIIDILGSGRFIFNLGHGIVPETPPDHVGQLVELVRSSKRVSS